MAERTKQRLGIGADGRMVLPAGDMYEVREPEAGFGVIPAPKNSNSEGTRFVLLAINACSEKTLFSDVMIGYDCI